MTQEAGHARLGITNTYIGARPAPPARTPEQKADIARLQELLQKVDLSDSEAAELGRLIQKLDATL